MCQFHEAASNVFAAFTRKLPLFHSIQSITHLINSLYSLLVPLKSCRKTLQYPNHNYCSLARSGVWCRCGSSSWCRVSRIRQQTASGERPAALTIAVASAVMAPNLLLCAPKLSYYIDSSVGCVWICCFKE